MNFDKFRDNPTIMQRNIKRTGKYIFQNTPPPRGGGKYGKSGHGEKK